MRFERTISNLGNSAALVIPPDLLKFLNLQRGETVILEDREGKHGPYLTIWKKEENVDDTAAIEEPTIPEDQ